MRRRGIFILACLAVVALLAAAILVGLRRTAPAESAIDNRPEPVEPLKQEVACIEGVLARNRLEANQVQAALDACR